MVRPISLGVKPLLPKNETRRLARLRELEIVDSGPDSTCDRIVSMTARIFDVPMVAVSLVEEFRVWFKASLGLNREEAPRDGSFCAHTILDDTGLVVPDTIRDQRFVHHPSVRNSDGVRFYAGAPLLTLDGLALGALCIMDRRPREFGPAEMDMLRDLTAIAAEELTLRKLAGKMRTEIDGRKRTERTLTRQHRLLQRLRGSLEDGIRQRTADLSRVNLDLRDEIVRREQIELDRANLGRLIEASPDFVALATLDGWPTFINDAGLRLMELRDLDEAVQHRLSHFFAPEDRARIEEAVLPKVLAEGRADGDYRFCTFRTGRFIPVRGNLFVVRDPKSGEPVALAAMMRDVTERQRGEAALRQAKEEAEKANAAKSEFLSRMSHELRTPLNAILGFGQLLQKQAEAEVQRDCANHVVTAGRHLLGLINEVLDIASIEAGKFELSLGPVRVADVVRDMLQLIQPLATERGINFEVTPAAGCAAWILADRQRFKQVLLNLLSNAVKYGREGGCVAIRSRVERTGQVWIGITDDGPGIPPEVSPRLFTAFERLGAERSKIQGTGLGLALSKRLVEAMNGRIGVETAPGRGSTFWLRLPRTRPESRAQPERPPLRLLATDLPIGRQVPGSPGVHPAGTVLYIEDNVSNRRLVERLLAPYQEVKLLCASSAAEGLAMARHERPDLILLDLHLPDEPGLDLLARLRRDKVTDGIPVVAVSADATGPTVERLIAAGVQAYLTKPIDFESLYRLLPGRPGRTAPSLAPGERVAEV